MKRTFIYTDEKSNKFWTIEITGNSYTVNYGKTGTAGQTQTKDFADEAVCQKAADKLIAEKMKKGYVETDALPAAPKVDKPSSSKKYKTFMKAYECEEDMGDDDDEDEEDYMIDVINVDIEDKDHIIAAIKAVSKKLKNEEFLEGLDDGESFPRFGKVEKKVLVEEYPGFYNYAVAYEDARPHLQKLCEQIIAMNYDNSGCPTWEDEEDMLGVRPAFALACADKKYIDTAIDMMRSMYNGDHTTPTYYSGKLFEQWGPCPETIKYFAASVIAMPMQDLAAQVFAALAKDGYKEYLKDEKNIDLFLKHYAHYMGESVHYDYKQEHRRKHLLQRMIPGVFKHLLTDGDEEKATVLGQKFVNLLLEGKQPDYQLLMTN